MNKLLLVDGSNLLFQMFYGMPARIVNENGRAIQGTLGFVGALLKIIRWTEPTHVTVLFDGEHPHDRAELDTAYKANRPAFDALLEEETPFSQLSDVYDALDFMQIAHQETTNCEVDDWIAAYALTFGDEIPTVIASMDSDFFQLITNQVSVFRYRGKSSVLCNPTYIQGKLGIEPSQYADWKALTGDQADNIRGVPKIGPKTAAMLLSQFGDLERILEHAEEISKPSVRQALIENADRARRNLALIRLEKLVSLPFPLDRLTWQDNGMSTTEILRAIGLK